jgi:hypothetical protein
MKQQVDTRSQWHRYKIALRWAYLVDELGEVDEVEEGGGGAADLRHRSVRRRLGGLVAQPARYTDMSSVAQQKRPGHCHTPRFLWFVQSHALLLLRTSFDFSTRTGAFAGAHLQHSARAKTPGPCLGARPSVDTLTTSATT